MKAYKKFDLTVTIIETGKTEVVHANFKQSAKGDYLMAFRPRSDAEIDTSSYIAIFPAAGRPDNWEGAVEKSNRDNKEHLIEIRDNGCMMHNYAYKMFCNYFEDKLDEAENKMAALKDEIFGDLIKSSHDAAVSGGVPCSYTLQIRNLISGLRESGVNTNLVWEEIGDYKVVKDIEFVY